LTQFNRGRSSHPEGQTLVFRARVGTRALVVVTVLAAAGCGSTASVPWAEPQTLSLGWHENCGTRADRIPIETRRLTVGERRWRVELSFRNETGVTLSVLRPHAVGETLFGLEPFGTTSLDEVRRRVDVKPRTFADRFTPSTPRLLEPGDRWSGAFSGRGRLPAETPVRVVLGRFVITGKVPRGLARGFLCVSERYVRLR
jgi:hypothetical protein